MLLVEMLKQMDNLELFLRVPGGPVPFLLLDGHDSRLSLAFLRYINNPTHYWACCLGLPNGTAFWQVGDSTQQNGLWKIELVRAKRDLMIFRRRNGLGKELVKTDIIPLVNVAWAKSFAIIDSNKTAIG